MNLRKTTEVNKEGKPLCTRYWFYCPGCKCPHAYRVAVENGENKQPLWEFTGDLEKPTFSPSLLAVGEQRCHLYVKDGQIQFLSDCHHELAGQTVPIPEFEW